MKAKSKHHCGINDGIRISSDRSKKAKPRRGVRRSLRLNEKLRNSESDKSNKSKKIKSRNSEKNKENNQDYNTNCNMNQMQEKRLLRSSATAFQHILKSSALENMLKAARNSKPTKAASNNVPMFNSKTNQSNLNRKQLTNKIDTTLNSKLRRCKESAQPGKKNLHKLKSNTQMLSIATQLRNEYKCAQRKQTKWSKTVSPILTPPKEKTFGTQHTRKSNNFTYSEQLANFTKLRHKFSQQSQSPLKQHLRTEYTTILPDVYPFHFKSELPNDKLSDTLKANDNSLMPPRVAYESYGMKAVSPATFSSTTSSPSLPESLRGVFETDNISELLRIDRVIYRLNAFHVKVLAKILNVNSNYLSIVLDTVVELATPNIMLSNKCESSSETSDIKEHERTSSGNSSVIFASPQAVHSRYLR